MDYGIEQQMKKTVKQKAVVLSTTLAVLGTMPVGALAEETTKTKVDQLRVSESDQVEQGSLYNSDIELENKVDKEVRTAEVGVKQATEEVKQEATKEEVKPENKTAEVKKEEKVEPVKEEVKQPTQENKQQEV
ncbi:SH3 domain-containing protein, partial [Bacillus cereus]